MESANHAEAQALAAHNARLGLNGSQDERIAGLVLDTVKISNWEIDIKEKMTAYSRGTKRNLENVASNVEVVPSEDLDDEDVLD